MVTGDIYRISSYTTTHYRHNMGRCERGEIQTLELTHQCVPLCICRQCTSLLKPRRMRRSVRDRRHFTAVGFSYSRIGHGPGRHPGVPHERFRTVIFRFRITSSPATTNTNHINVSPQSSQTAETSRDPRKKRPRPANPHAFRGPIPRYFINVFAGYCIAPAGISYR